MGAGKQIFAVDTATGQVYIAGNLFVQSADDAGGSWIVGEMISASSVIQLADGAIVLDGVNGRITVFDPANLSNGNFIRIENGFVKQYENFVLKRQLVNLETGIAYNGKWQSLLGRYEKTPVVFISPYVMNTYTPEESAQGQHLNMKVDRIEALGNGQYRFLPYATLMTENVEYNTQPPPWINNTGLDENGNFDPSLTPLFSQTPMVPFDSLDNSYPNVTVTTGSVTVKGRIKATVTAQFVAYSNMYNSYGYNDKSLGLIGRWRAKYRLNGGSWQYSGYSTTDISPNQGNTPISKSLTLTFGSGVYEICFEWNCYVKTPVVRGNTNYGTGGYFKISQIHLSAASIETLATGSVSYIAVGE